MNRAAEIKIRAERRAGEILSEVERKQGGDVAGRGRPKDSSRHDGAGYRETIKKAEIPETTARRWQAEASIRRSA